MVNYSKYVIDKIQQYYSKTLNMDKIDNSDIFLSKIKVNNIKDINSFHKSINSKLKINGIYVTYLESLEHRQNNLTKNIYNGFKNIFLFKDFIIHRIMPKIFFMKNIYYFFNKKINRAISKTEGLGRLIACGFEVLDFFDYDNKFYIICKKNKNSNNKINSSNGLLFKMKRVGYKGKMIDIYKLRTMHPYSEFCQELIMDTNKLESSGKISNDFRVTIWGKFLRKFWIDEFPMFINFFKRELNLIGVRPLSLTYYNKYPKEIQELRIKVKPGLLPPYYADLPSNFNEIVLSEKKYLKQKINNAILTDIKYFLLIFKNIVFKGARSK